MPTLHQLPPYLIALWGAAGLAAFLVCLPPLLQFLGLSRLVNRFDESPGTVEPTDDDPAYADIYRQLLALGLRPLGSCWEQYWFFNGHWTKAFHHRVFGSRDRKCFACVYRLVSGEPVRVALATCFTDEALVWTANHFAEFRQLEEDHVRWGINTSDLAELLDSHRQVVEDFVAHGHPVGDHDSLPLLAATLYTHNRRYIRGERHSGLTHLKYAFFWLGIGPLVARTFFGLGNWVLPVAVIAGAAAKALLEHAIHWEIRRLRAREVADARAAEGAGQRHGPA
jgi:hypothetical protein